MVPPDTVPSMNTTPICMVLECERPLYAKDVCRLHYDRQRTGTPQDAPLQQHYSGSLLDRLYARISIGEENECWPWTGSLNESGYGQLGHTPTGRSRLAHRLIYEETHTIVLPSDVAVCHRCDNPPCCNYLQHLWVGSQTENMADCAQKGRIKSGFVGLEQRGEKNPSAKLLTADVYRIKKLIAEHIPDKEIAPLFRVAPHTIGKIRRGERWSHL